MEQGAFSAFRNERGGAKSVEPTEGSTKKKSKADKRVSRRKKLTVAATGVLVGITGFSVFASWTDSSQVGTSMSTGKFDVEMRVNGGAWTTATTKQTLTWAPSSTGAPNLVPATAKLAPGDALKSRVEFRLSGDSTHKGKISQIALSSAGTTNLDIPWTLKNGSTTVVSRPTLASHTTNPDIVLTPGTGTTPGAVVALDMDFTVGDNLAQSATVSPEWTFVSELDN